MSDETGGVMSARSMPSYHPYRSPEARDTYLSHYDARAGSFPVPSETETVSTDLGDTFVRVSGPSDGPPLVMFPGIWSDSLMWPPGIITPLSERYRIYAVDNIYDFGRSVNAKPSTSRDDYMAWLDGLFDGLGIKDGINLLGVSLGAWIAGEYILHAPDRLAKVAWLSPGGVVLSPVSRRTMLGIPLMTACLIAPSPSTVGSLMRWLMPNWAQSEGTARDEFDDYVEQVALGLGSFGKRPLAKGINRRFTDEELRCIGVPVLYLAGEQERFCSPHSAVSRLAAVAPQIETMVFKNVGHELVQLEAQAVSRRLLEFLQ